jgi:hypothetical protein
MYTKPKWQVTEGKEYGRREGGGDKSIFDAQRAFYMNIMTCKIYLKLYINLKETFFPVFAHHVSICTSLECLKNSCILQPQKKLLAI